MTDRAALYARLPLLESDRWWVDRAREAPVDTVIEVGAGTGRLTRSFLDAGFRVEAVERDAAMLEMLGELDHDRLRIHAGDVTTMPAGHRVGLVALPAALLNELPDATARRDVLRWAADRCHRDGHVAMHLLGPWWLVRLPTRSTGRLHPADGGPPVDVTVSAADLDVWSARRRATLSYRFGDGTVLRDQLDAAIVTPPELEEALGAAGLEVVGRWGAVPPARPCADDVAWHVLARPRR